MNLRLVIFIFTFCFALNAFAIEDCAKALTSNNEELFLGIDNSDYVLIFSSLEKITNINAKNDLGQTALMRAAEIGDWILVTLLLDYPKIKVNEIDKYGDTALTKASRNGHEYIVKSLVEFEGIDVNLQGRPVIKSSSNEGISIAQASRFIFTGKFDPEISDTPLIAASRNGHESIIKILLEIETIKVNLTGHLGDTALIVASQNSHLASVKALLNDGRVNINSIGDSEVSALGYAIINYVTHKYEFKKLDGVVESIVSTLQPIIMGHKLEIVRILHVHGAFLDSYTSGWTYRVRNSLFRKSSELRRLRKIMNILY